MASKPKPFLADTTTMLLGHAASIGKQFNKYDVLPKVINLARKHHISGDVLLEAYCRETINYIINQFKEERSTHNGFFNTERLLILGESETCLQRHATRTICRLEADVMKANAERQANAWERAQNFLAERDAMFNGFPATATYEEVLQSKKRRSKVSV
jgi:hypothetical protein